MSLALMCVNNTIILTGMAWQNFVFTNFICNFVGIF